MLVIFDKFEQLFLSTIECISSCRQLSRRIHSRMIGRSGRGIGRLSPCQVVWGILRQLSLQLLAEPPLLLGPQEVVFVRHHTKEYISFESVVLSDCDTLFFMEGLQDRMLVASPAFTIDWRVNLIKIMDDGGQGIFLLNSSQISLWHTKLCTRRRLMFVFSVPARKTLNS